MRTTPRAASVPGVDAPIVIQGLVKTFGSTRALDGLDLELSHWSQMDRALWPSMAETFAARFATRPRDEWARTFEGTDACVTPVLDWAEAADNAHLGARGTLQRGKGAVQPAPAPRFSATPSSVRPAQTLSFEEASRRWDARERLEEAT